MYRKVIGIVVAVALITGASVFARCLSCQEKLAIRQSIQAALAASLADRPSAAHVKPGKQIDSLDEAKESKEVACCSSCADGHECDNKRCATCGGKAPRPENESSDESTDGGCKCSENKCLLESFIKKNQACCKAIKHKIKEQSHDAKKCCKKIKDQLEDLEDLIIDQTIIDSACCSLIEALILTQTDEAEACCSSTQDIINSRLDILEINISINESLSDACCLSTQETINSRLDILEINISINDSLSDACCLSTQDIVNSRLDILEANDVAIIALLNIIVGCTCGG